MRPSMIALRRRTIGFLLGGGTLAAILPAQPVASADRFELTPSSEDFAAPIDDFSPADEARLAVAIDSARTRLYAAGRLPLPNISLSTTFAWPLRSAGIGYFSYDATSAFVDQNTAVGPFQDWNCGARSYDQHRGTDIFTWPYGWLSMDLARLEVVAAAPGTILVRADGNFDRSCAAGGGNANRVVVQHADGSTAIYVHFKNGSVTPKQVGEAVAAGEYLGVVGSSGSSTGPHLHFEVHDTGTYPGPLLDPYDGLCEALTLESLWAQQPAYRQPTINHASTGFAAPVLPACPTQETPNEKRIFVNGDPIYFRAWVRDFTTGLELAFAIHRPNGTLYQSTSYTATQDSNAAWVSWNNPGFGGGAAGRWTFEVTLAGITRTRAFWMGALFADDFEDAHLGAWSAAVP